MMGQTLDISIRTFTLEKIAKGSLLVLCVLVAACDAATHTDLKSKIAAVKARPASKIPSLPSFKPYETFSYDSTIGSDPFKPFDSEDVSVDATSSETDSPLAGRNLETLEQYPLDTIRYVGQLEKGGEEWAIVTSPDYIVHRVRVGNYLGQNYGKITAIAEDHIDILETIEDGLGGWINREAALSLME